MFAGVTPGTPQVDAERVRRNAMRRSVIDEVRKDFGSLESKLGRADQLRFENHLDSIRAIESRLTDQTTGGGCDPTAPAGGGSMPDVLRDQIQIGVGAMACDLARVVTFQNSNGVGDEVHDWVTLDGKPIAGGHHALSHENGEAPTPAGGHRRAIAEINRWYATQFASLLQQMNAVKEGDGTLLDNSVVVWVNDLSNGATHSHGDANYGYMPYLIAGGGAGYFRTGRYVDLGGATRTHNDLWVSICQAFGLPLTKFGDPNLGSGAITQLR